MAGWKNLLAILGLLGGAVSVLYWINHQDTASQASKPGLPIVAADVPEEDLADLSLPPGVTQADYDRAMKWFADMYPGVDADTIDVLSMAGELAVADQRYEIALASFRAIPSDHQRYGPSARLQQGTSALELHRAVEAEKSLREYLNLAKQSQYVRFDDVVAAYKWLNYILSVELRLEDRKLVMRELHQFGLADILDSKQYFFPNLLILNSPAGRARLQQFVDADPENVVLRIAQGRYKTLEGEFEQGVVILGKVLAENPGNVSAIAGLLEALFELNDWERFAGILGQAPPFDENEPWLLTRMRGEYALEERANEEALRYFQFVLKQDPANAPCQMGVVTALAELGRTDEHEVALQRSGILAEIRVNLSNADGDAFAALQGVSRNCQQIGFVSAAQAFAKYAEGVAEK